MQRDRDHRPTIDPAPRAIARWASGQFGGSPWSRNAAGAMAVLIGLLFVLLAVVPRIAV